MRHLRTTMEEIRTDCPAFAQADEDLFDELILLAGECLELARALDRGRRAG